MFYLDFLKVDRIVLTQNNYRYLIAQQGELEKCISVNFELGAILKGSTT